LHAIAVLLPFMCHPPTARRMYRHACAAIAGDPG
jgi:hypothetical protein